MHRRHRVPGVRIITNSKLGSQLTEPGRQHYRILGGELPGHPDRSQVPMRVLQRDAGLSCSPQPAQHHCPGPRIIAGSESDIEFGE